MIFTIAVFTVKNTWWCTDELSETCRVLFQKQIWEISASSWFHYKDLSRCTVTWTSKIQASLHSAKNDRYFTRIILLRMRNIPDKICRDKTRVTCNNFYPKIVLFLRHSVQPDRPQMTIWYGAEEMRFACRVTKARIQTHTPAYLITITVKSSEIFCWSTTMLHFHDNTEIFYIVDSCI